MIYAIGDVHGRSDLLAPLLAKIAEDAKSSVHAPTLVFLGDYVDRGPDSKGVIDLVLAGIPGFDVVRLKGNHEDMMAAWLFEGDPRMARAWMMNGAGATLRSYGLTGEVTPRMARPVIPGAHREFLSHGMKMSHDAAPYFFAHAGIQPGVPLHAQLPMDLMWIRSEFHASAADHGRVIVHGHTPNDEPEVEHNRINVDTGAFATGRLTCVALNGGAPRFLYAEDNDPMRRPVAA